MNVMMLLEMAAQGFGDREAVRCGDDAFHFGQLLRASGRAASALRTSGAAHVALLDETSPAVPLALFASAWAGLPFAPLNYRLTADEVEALLERLSPCVLITGEERAAAFADRPGTRVWTREAFLDRARSEGEPADTWSMDPDDVALLLFTSGTTGVPKAAVLRQQHLVSYVLGSVEFAAAAEDETALVSVPPYHIAGMAAVLSSVYAGRRIVQLPRFEAKAWLALAGRERVSHAFVVPTMLARIVDELGAAPDAGLPALRALSYGGGKMPLPVIEAAMQRFPATSFANAYGLTETSSTISVLGPDDHRAAASSDAPEVRRRLTSVGRALPGVEIEIRDEEGRPVPPGTRGEVHVRGEQVSGEYLGRDIQRTPDGFFPTRDGGHLDAEGYLFLEGRIDDVIVRGGENLSPGEIEDVLHAHPEVRDCAVVGVPDPQWGEAVAAAVVLRPDATPDRDALCAWVKRHLRSNRVPARVVFRDELPYNETGKLLRRLVRDELVAADDTGAAS